MSFGPLASAKVAASWNVLFDLSGDTHGDLQSSIYVFKAFEVLLVVCEMSQVVVTGWPHPLKLASRENSFGTDRFYENTKFAKMGFLQFSHDLTV